MARMGGSQHLKRLAAPWFWPILRKEYKWVAKPSPGPHPVDRCLPLLVLVRDALGLAKTAREARSIIAEGKVLIDCVPRRDYKFPVGLMDSVAVPEVDLYLRIVPYPQKYLWYIPIPKEEAHLKLLRIENKTSVRGGHLQLNLHDGRNILLRAEGASKVLPPEARNYRTLDVILVDLRSNSILRHIPLEVGKLAIVMEGRNVGRMGKIVAIDTTSSLRRRRYLVTLEDSEGHRFQTILDYVMVVGDEKPLIKVCER